MQAMRAYIQGDGKKISLKYAYENRLFFREKSVVDEGRRLTMLTRSFVRGETRSPYIHART